MNLPTTREHTYGSNEPVRPNDINAIQDAITGAKHPEMERIFGAAAFTPLTTGADNYTANSVYTPDPTGNAFECALSCIPVGDRFTTLAFSFKRANAGNISYALCRKPLTGGALEVIATGTDNTTNGYVTRSLVAVNHVVATGYAYIARFFFDGAAAAATPELVGTSVKHDRL